MSNSQGGNDFWRRTKDALGGWKALLIVAVASSLGTLWLGDAIQAGDTAQTALAGFEQLRARQAEFEQKVLDRMSDMETSNSELGKTLRIYLCTREALEVSTRIRLECREFQ